MVLGRGTYYACQFGILAILAAQGSPESVGQYIFALAVCSPIFIFASLQLHVAQCTDHHGDFDFGDFSQLRTVTTLLALVLVCGIALWISDSRAAASTIIAVGLTKAVEAASDLCSGRLQKHERLRTIAISLMLRGVTALAVVAVVYPLTHNLVSSMIVMALGWLAVWACFDLPMVNSLPREKSRQSREEFSLVTRLIALGNLTLPLGIAAGVCALEVNIPRYFVQRLFGDYELGVLGVMAYLTLTGQLVIASLGQAAIPQLAGLYGRGQIKPFKKLVFQLCGVSALSGLALVGAAAAVGRVVLYYVFGPEYAEWNLLLVTISFAATLQFVAAMLSVTLRSMGEYQATLLAQAISLISVITFCLVLIPIAGLLGVGYAMVISSALSLAVFAFMVVSTVSGRFRQKVDFLVKQEMESKAETSHPYQDAFVRTDNDHQSAACYFHETVSAGRLK